MTREIVLRAMRWWDIEPVLALEAELFPLDAWSEGMYWSELAGAGGPHRTRGYLVAEDADGKLAGYAGLAVAGGTGDVMTIGVTGAHQGTGLGGRLLGELLADARRLGCREVLLEVRVDNVRAQRLYERFGFRRIGVRRGYYQPGNFDALVMRRELAPPESDEEETAEHG
ncbi:ribosomal protein S18-alanine N-acetyltransferase [Streptomyces sp. URMC 129]|uniref:ribosomal protein S18-alanine N-acetyltransferase n=1 Tax=Streptomyces sp. URMC 129 TaxID=3423407 RepID=UPI003F197334